MISIVPFYFFLLTQQIEKLNLENSRLLEEKNSKFFLKAGYGYFKQILKVLL